MNEAASKQAIKEAAQVLDASDIPPALEARGQAAVQVLVDAAVADGDLRPDITADDILILILILILMLSARGQLPQAARDRWLEIIFSGLRAS